MYGPVVTEVHAANHAHRLPVVRRHIHGSTRREPRYRGLIGLSDGGSAALFLAFRHPDVFGACGGHSGQYLLKRDWTIHKVLGPEPGSTRLLAENSPTLIADTLAAGLRGLSIYFDVGTSDEELEDNRALHRKLESGRHGFLDRARAKRLPRLAEKAILDVDQPLAHDNSISNILEKGYIQTRPG